MITRFIAIGVLLALALLGSMLVTALLEEADPTASAIDIPNRSVELVNEPGVVEISAGRIVRVDISVD